MRQAILAGASAAELSQLAAAEGMVSMEADGLRKAAAGKTSLAEILKLLQA